MSKVLVFGSLNLDTSYYVDQFVSKGETRKATDCVVCAGGKGLNQALAAGKAQADVFMAGNCGEDGKPLLELLEGNGIDCQNVWVHQGNGTGKAIIQIDQHQDNCILVNCGENLSNTPQQADEIFHQFAPGDFLVLQNEVRSPETLIELGLKHGLRVLFNPAPMLDNPSQLDLQGLDCLIVNETEAAQLLQISWEKDYRKLIARLYEKSQGTPILMTLSKHGALYMEADQAYFVPAFEVSPVDTTGAGDTFIGYFVAGKAKGLPIEACLLQAAAAAALSVCKEGAAQSVPDMQEVEEFLSRYPEMEILCLPAIQ